MNAASAAARNISNRESTMTTNAVSGTNPAASLSSLLGATRSFAGRTDNDGDPDSGAGTQGGSVQGGGGTLFTALLAALTQFVTSHSAGATGATSTPVTTTTPATTTPATATPAASGTSGTAGASSGAVPSSLPQDLHAFLHDLFRALRQEGHPRHEDDDDSRHSQVPSAPISTTPLPTPVTTTSTGTVTTPGVIPVTTPITTPNATPITAPTTTTDTGTTTSPVTAPPGIAQYGQRGLAAELTALIKDLANSGTASSAASPPSRVSADSLSNLNAAFAKLIGDLGGTVSGASTGTTTVPPATTAASHPDTSALQSFLTSFLQDLQGSAASAGTLGNGVNVTA